MPKTLIANRVNGSTKTFAVPATPAEAQAFCDANLEGEYAIYKSVAKIGLDTVTVAPLLIDVMFRDDTTLNKGYAKFVIPANKSENDLFAALMGTTLNGVHVDYVMSITQRICDKF